jgi:V-type H+-transporting ATPase subunit C
MSTTFWLVSAPADGDRMWTALNDNTSSMSKNFKLTIPKLRAGTLDSLMTLSDDLVKQDQQIEAALRKLERQMLEFGETDFTIQVDRKTVTTLEYVTDFKWASNKYQEKLSLPEITTKLFQDVIKVDEDLRSKQAEYNGVKSSLQAQERKTKGTLSVRSLTTLGLKSSDFIDTENFVTVVVVVPKSDSRLWLDTYEKGFLGEERNLGFYPVLLGSSKRILEEEAEELWTVTLFKRKIQDFKTAVREKQPRWTVREYVFDEEALHQEKASMEQIQQHEIKTKKGLITWAKAMYGEVFRAYVHVKIIRLFVESSLRYGVPPDFQAVLMKPSMKYEKSLRDALLSQFRNLGSANLFANTDEAAAAAGGLGGQEFYPYVFLSLNVTNS